MLSAGLIDAVQTLQRRNCLLHEELDKARSKPAELQNALDVKSRQLAEALSELQQCREEIAAEQGRATAELQQCHDQLVAAQSAAAAASEQVAAAEREKAALLQQCEELRNKLSSAESEEQQALQVSGC